MSLPPFLTRGARHLSIELESKIDFKYMEVSDLLINLDRLTRFKLPSIKYPRVYRDILSKFLIHPKYSLRQIDNLEPESAVKLVETIWNSSVEKIFSSSRNVEFHNLFKLYDSLVFESCDANIDKLMSVNLSINELLYNTTNEMHLPKNLLLFKQFVEKNEYKSIEYADFYNTLSKIRTRKKLQFPVTKLVLVEGITEEILLPKFANKLGYDFDEFGVFVLGAGGKSKMPSLYSTFQHYLKIPILVLLDNDASQIYEIVKSNLSDKDKIILINNGEFEDIVSKNLIKRSFNENFYDIEKVIMSELKECDSMCENIANIYKSRALGEFQKAHFAKILANNIKYDTDVSSEIEEIIAQLKAI